MRERLRVGWGRCRNDAGRSLGPCPRSGRLGAVILGPRWRPMVRLSGRRSIRRSDWFHVKACRLYRFRLELRPVLRYIGTRHAVQVCIWLRGRSCVKRAWQGYPGVPTAFLDGQFGDAPNAIQAQDRGILRVSMLQQESVVKDVRLRVAFVNPGSEFAGRSMMRVDRPDPCLRYDRATAPFQPENITRRDFFVRRSAVPGEAEFHLLAAGQNAVEVGTFEHDQVVVCGHLNL
jgi:hypothetical protein